MRVALYARVSTDDKGQDPETQLRPLREFAVQQRYDVVGEYKDFASALDMRGRKDWRELLDLADRRRVDSILIWRMDRVFRSSLDAATTIERLQRAGVGLKSLQEPWLDTTNPDDPMQDFLVTIIVGVAQLERGIIRQRVRAGVARAKAEGKRLGRPPRDFTPEQRRAWPAVVEAMEAGHMTRRVAAKRLGVRYSSLLTYLRVPKTGSENGHSAELAEAPLEEGSPTR